MTHVLSSKENKNIDNDVYNQTFTAAAKIDQTANNVNTDIFNEPQIHVQDAQGSKRHVTNEAINNVKGESEKQHCSENIEGRYVENNSLEVFLDTSYAFRLTIRMSIILCSK